MHTQAAAKETTMIQHKSGRDLQTATSMFGEKVDHLLGWHILADEKLVCPTSGIPTSGVT